jgi:hypothetical protein
MSQKLCYVIIGHSITNPDYFWGLGVWSVKKDAREWMDLNLDQYKEGTVFYLLPFPATMFRGMRNGERMIDRSQLPPEVRKAIERINRAKGMGLQKVAVTDSRATKWKGYGLKLTKFEVAATHFGTVPDVALIRRDGVSIGCKQQHLEAVKDIWGFTSRTTSANFPPRSLKRP